MKGTIALTILLMFILFINIFLLATGIILVWRGQDSAYLKYMPRLLIEIRKDLTKFPCLHWHKKIANEMSSIYYSSCKEDRDCIWYPSCEFGCHRAINVKNKKQLQEKIIKWKEFCWQNDPCEGKDYTCSEIQVRCIQYQCQAVLKQ